MVEDFVILSISFLITVFMLSTFSELFKNMRKSWYSHYRQQRCLCGRYRFNGSIQITIDDEDTRHAEGLCQPIREAIG